MLKFVMPAAYLVLAAAHIMQAQTRLYFRDASVPPVEPMPNSHQTGDVFQGGNWRGRVMDANYGFATESAVCTLTVGTWYHYRAVTFTSPSLTAQSVPAGAWTIRIFNWESSPANNAFVRYMVYSWMFATDSFGDTIVPVTTHTVEIGTTKSLQTITAAGVAFTVASGDKICIDLEIESKSPGQTRYVEYYYGGFADSSSLTSPVSLGPLAVSLAYFTASQQTGNSVALRWRTESEEDTYLWEIERSVKADENYAQIGTLPGQGTTSQQHDYEYANREELEAGTYWYRLCEVELSGKRSYYGPVSLDYYPGGRSEFALGAARPNPFNQITTISYQIAKGGPASLKVYNVLGQEVRTLAEGEHRAGRHQAVWDGRDGRGRKVSSGVYFYRLTAAGGEAGENRASGKLLRLR